MTKQIEKNCAEPESKELVPQQLLDNIGELLASVGDISNKIFNKPTSIEKVISVPYKITKENILDLHNTIEHKINQSRIKHSNFEINLFFNDKTSETFPSIDSFMDLHETQSTCAQTLRMVWDITLIFENCESISEKIGEKQRIEILFTMPPEDIPENERAFYMFNNHTVDGEGIIQISINHSNKIWAVEVIKHVEDFVDRIVKTSEKRKSFSTQKEMKSVNLLKDS